MLLNPALNCLTNCPYEINKITGQHWQPIWRGSSINIAQQDIFFTNMGQGISANDLAEMDIDFGQLFRIPLEKIEHIVASKKETSPGKDGIPFLAYKKVFTIFCPLLKECIEHCFYGDSDINIPKSFLELLLIFLPKTISGSLDGNAYYTSKDLRPISIGLCSARLMSSVIRIGLDEYCSKFIGRYQSGFISGRQIFDPISSVLSWFYTRRVQNQGGFVFLIDFSAAFSSISFSFLRRALVWLGWPARMVEAMISLFCGGEHFLRVGGRRMRHSTVLSGTRQGDPCSPLIFVIVLDLFIRYLVKNTSMVESGIYAFADDLGLLINSLPETLASEVPEAFHLFAGSSGPKVNLRKTVIVPVRALSRSAKLVLGSSPWADLLQNVKKCAKYLGIPFGNSCDDFEVYRDAFQIFESRLALLKNSHFSFRTRLLIIDTFLLPVFPYVSSMYLAPKIILDRCRVAILDYVVPFRYLCCETLENLDLYFSVRGCRKFSWVNESSILRNHFGRRFVFQGDHALNPFSVYCKVLQKFEATFHHSYSDFVFNLRQQYINPGLILQKKTYESFRVTSSLNSEVLARYRARFSRWYGIPNFTIGFDTWRDHLKVVKNPFCREAYLKFGLNGWCTKKRARFWLCVQDFHCNFCGRYEDSIEHYINCPTLNSVYRIICRAYNISADDQSWFLSGDFDFFTHFLGVLYMIATLTNVSHTFGTALGVPKYVQLFEHYRCTSKYAFSNIRRRPRHVSDPVCVRDLPFCSFYTVFFEEEFYLVSYIDQDLGLLDLVHPLFLQYSETTVCLDGGSFEVSSDTPVHLFLDGSYKVVGSDEFMGLGIVLLGLASSALEFAVNAENTCTWRSLEAEGFSRRSNVVSEFLCFLHIGDWLLRRASVDSSFRNRKLSFFFDSELVYDIVRHRYNLKTNTVLHRFTWNTLRSLRSTFEDLHFTMYIRTEVISSTVELIN